MPDPGGRAFSDCSVEPSPGTGIRLFDLYHGSKTAPLCQGDALAQAGHAGQAGAGGPVECLGVLLQGPGGILGAFVQLAKLASRLHNRDMNDIK